MKYIDGFLIALPKNKLKAYQAMSNKAGKIWKEYGALDYKESYGEDLKHKGMASFSKAAKTKSSEVVIFAYILYKSKKHRNEVNAKVMKDKRLHDICDPKDMPFDVKRMAYGGFQVMVDPYASSKK